MTADDPSMEDGVPPPASAAERAEAAAVGAASFVLALRSSGIGDVPVLRAMELVPREVFAPRRFADLARTDVALPLPCGQTMTAPGTVAHVLQALAVRQGQRVLEVGTGSGYVTALLAALGAEVVSLERFATLSESAALHLRAAGIDGPVRLETADGLAPRVRERFDRILLNGSVAAFPETLAGLLGPSGRAVLALSGGGTPRLARIVRGVDGGLAQEILSPVKLSPLIAGVARAL